MLSMHREILSESQKNLHGGLAVTAGESSAITRLTSTQRVFDTTREDLRYHFRTMIVLKPTAQSEVSGNT